MQQQLIRSKNLPYSYLGLGAEREASYQDSMLLTGQEEKISQHVILEKDDEKRGVRMSDLKKLLRYFEIKPNAINYACEYGDLSSVKLFESIGKVCSEEAIENAEKSGHYDLITHLTLNKLSQDMNEFGTACHEGNLEVVKFIIDYNQKKGIFKQEDYSRGMLYACVNAHKQIMEYLNNYGIPVNEQMYKYCVNKDTVEHTVVADWLFEKLGMVKKIEADTFDLIDSDDSSFNN